MHDCWFRYRAAVRREDEFKYFMVDPQQIVLIGDGEYTFRCVQGALFVTISWQIRLNVNALKQSAVAVWNEAMKVA